MEKLTKEQNMVFEMDNFKNYIFRADGKEYIFNKEEFIKKFLVKKETKCKTYVDNMWEIYYKKCREIEKEMETKCPTCGK